MGKDFDNPWGLTTKKGDLKPMSMLFNSAVFPGNQGGPLEHVIAAKAVSFKEVLDPAFKEYAANVIKNSKTMADVFLQDPDFRIISGGTENHLFLVDVTKVVENGKVAQNLLDEVNITLNKNSIPSRNFVTIQDKWDSYRSSSYYCTWIW